MNWQTGMMLVVTLACVVPGLVALLVPRKPRNRIRPDRVAERHRAIAMRGFKSRMQNHREYGL